MSDRIILRAGEALVLWRVAAPGGRGVPPRLCPPPMTETGNDRDGLRYTVALIEIQGGLVGLWERV
jgi:hypothetical protein